MSNKYICRTCTNSETSVVSLFIHKIGDELLKDILINCTSIKISENDLLPQMICNSCVETLLISYRFMRNCQENDLKLRTTLTEVSSCSPDINIESSVDSYILKSIKDVTLTEHCKAETNKLNKAKLQCDLCGKTFTKKSSLKYHFRIHSGERNFICSECNRSFPTCSQLSVHQRSHNGYKPHVCKVCKKTFSKSSNLNVHLLVHRNEKRFTCNVCKKKFAQKIHLISHQNLHIGFRPFSCHCGAAFITEANLKRHANTHGGIKNYLCNFCGNLFASCNELNRHLLTHSIEAKEFICDICFKHFTRLASLNRHMKKFH